MNLIKVISLALFLMLCRDAFSQTVIEKPFEYAPELEELAEKGDIDAMYKVGLCYYVGNKGVTDVVTGPIPMERDLKKAFNYFEKAAQRGSALAMLNLGNIYSTGLGSPKGKNLKTALEWYEKAIKNGCADGFTGIAQMCANNSPKDVCKLPIIKIKTNGSDENTEDAMREIAQVSRDNFFKAAELGSARAAYNLSMLYISGLFIAADFEQSNKWLSKAIELGNSSCLNLLAVRYQLGWAVPKDNRMAMILYLGGAMKGDRSALSNAAALFSSFQHYEQALFCYMKQEELGAAKGKTQSADLTSFYHNYYLEGVHGAKDFESEQAWLESVREEFRNIQISDIAIPDPQIVLTLDSTFVVNDFGRWYITDKDGIIVSEHKYDKISQDSETRALTAWLNGHKTLLHENGIEETPISTQILMEMENYNGVDANIAYEVLKDYNSGTYYKAIAYYNQAVRLLERRAYYSAELHLRKALELEPDFEEAKECLTYLTENIEQLQKEKRAELKKQRKQERNEKIKMFIDAAATVLSEQASRNSQFMAIGNNGNFMTSEGTQTGTKQGASKSNEKKNTKSEMVTRGNAQARNAHQGYASLLTDMKNNGQYGTSEFRRIQALGKKLEKQYGLPHFEQFDW